MARNTEPCLYRVNLEITSTRQKEFAVHTHVLDLESRGSDIRLIKIFAHWGFGSRDTKFFVYCSCNFSREAIWSKKKASHEQIEKTTPVKESVEKYMLKIEDEKIKNEKIKDEKTTKFKTVKCL